MTGAINSRSRKSPMTRPVETFKSTNTHTLARVSENASNALLIWMNNEPSRRYFATDRRNNEIDDNRYYHGISTFDFNNYFTDIAKRYREIDFAIVEVDISATPFVKNIYTYLMSHRWQCYTCHEIEIIFSFSHMWKKATEVDIFKHRVQPRAYNASRRSFRRSTL